MCWVLGKHTCRGRKEDGKKQSMEISGRGRWLVDSREYPRLSRWNVKNLDYWVDAVQEGLPQLCRLPLTRVQAIEISLLHIATDKETFRSEREWAPGAAGIAFRRPNGRLKLFLIFQDPRQELFIDIPAVLN